MLQAAGLWLNVPFVQQEENGCGSAALAMVMRYWEDRGGTAAGETADARHIQNDLFSPVDRGIPASAMAPYLEAHGFRAIAFHGQWADLREQLAKGRPLIVCLDGGKALHYVVVAAWDDNAAAVNDPADRKLRRLDRREFEKRWKAAGNWTLLAVPRPQS